MLFSVVMGALIRKSRSQVAKHLEISLHVGSIVHAIYEFLKLFTTAAVVFIFEFFQARYKLPLAYCATGMSVAVIIIVFMYSSGLALGYIG